MSGNLNHLDIVIVIAYLLFITGTGFHFARRVHSSSDYFLAGRNLGWLVIGASIFAISISSEHMIGLAGSGAKNGFAIGQIEWLASFVLLILVWTILPRYISTGIKTIPEFLGNRYNASLRSIISLFMIIIMLSTRILLTLLVGGWLLNMTMGWNTFITMIILLLITGLYTITGGLRAIIKTEFLQSIFLIAGVLIVTLSGLNEIGGISKLHASFSDEFYCSFRSITDSNFPWTGIVLGVPIIAFWYWCTDQVTVQRLISARNIDQARSGAILSGFLNLLPLFLIVLPGLLAITLFPEISGYETFPTFVNSHLIPHGLKGIVVAGILAAIMSSLSSSLNSSATLFSYDIYGRMKPHATDHELLLVGRLATTIFVIIGILLLPLIHSTNIDFLVYLFKVQFIFSPPITAILLMGLISSKVNTRGAFVTFISGTVLAFMKFLLDLYPQTSHSGFKLYNWFVSLNYLHFIIILFLICSGILFGVSYYTGRSRQVRLAGDRDQFFTAGQMRIKDLITGKDINLYASLALVVLIVIIWTILI